MVFSLLVIMLRLDGVSNTADGATLCGAMSFLNYGSHCVVPLYCVNTATSTTIKDRQTNHNGTATHLDNSQESKWVSYKKYGKCIL